MQNIVIGTNNKGKLKEYKFFLSDFFNVLTPADLGIDFNVAETGTTYEENSLLKLEFLRNKNLNMAILCDDSGLEIESLNNEPGVYSARYAGEQASYQDNCEKLLKNMMRVPKEDREAKFRTVIAYKDDNRELSCDGSVKGEIALSPKGSFGFGYDSVFYYPPLEKTFAELSEEEKNSISHRGRALRKFLLLFNDKK